MFLMVVKVDQHIVHSLGIVTLTKSLKYLRFHEFPRKILVLCLPHLLQILFLVKEVLENLTLVRLYSLEKIFS